MSDILKAAILGGVYSILFVLLLILQELRL